MGRTGLGMNLYVGGRDLSNDIGQLDAVEQTRGLLDATGLDKSAVERLHGLQSGRIAFTGFFNDATDQEHDALKGLPTADVIVMLFHSTTLGDEAAGIIGKQIGYGWTRGADGSLGITTEVQSDDDQLNYGLALTAGKRTDSGATNGSSVDFLTGSTSFGLVAYLEVFAFTGTSVTVTIEESSDDGVGDPFAAVTGGAFAAVSGANVTERIETSLTQTVERYLRAVTAGIFTNAEFAVVAKRYAAANAER